MTLSREDPLRRLTGRIYFPPRRLSKWLVVQAGLLFKAREHVRPCMDTKDSGRQGALIPRSVEDQDTDGKLRRSQSDLVLIL